MTCACRLRPSVCNPVPQKLNTFHDWTSEPPVDARMPCDPLPGAVTFLLSPKECPLQGHAHYSHHGLGGGGDNFRSNNGEPRKHLAPVLYRAHRINQRTQCAPCFYNIVYIMTMFALDHQKCTVTQWGQKGQGLPWQVRRLRHTRFLVHRRSKRWSGHLLTLVSILHSQPHCFQLVVLLLKMNVFFFTSPHLGWAILSLTHALPLPHNILYHQCYTIYVLVHKYYVQLLSVTC